MVNRHSQIFSLYLHRRLARILHAEIHHSPVVVYRLDNEAQRRAYCADVFVENILYNRRLSGIVQSPAPRVRPVAANGAVTDSQHQNAHLLVLEPRLAQN